MEILQLKYFCDAAETENFSATAKKFLVPPSNISQTVKRLESELGTELFERRANKIKLNEAGLLFYKNVKSALELLDNAKSALNAPAEQNAIKINIQILRCIVMEAVEDFRKINPEIAFITDHNTERPTDDYDLVVTDKELSLPYIKTKTAEESFLLAYNKHTFSIDEDPKKAQLEKLPFITMGVGTSIFNAIEKNAERLNFRPNIALQTEDPFYVRKCIELGLGISIVPELSWRGQFSSDIALKSIGDIKRKIYVYKKLCNAPHVDAFHTRLLEKLS